MKISFTQKIMYIFLFIVSFAVGEDILSKIYTFFYMSIVMTVPFYYLNKLDDDLSLFEKQFIGGSRFLLAIALLKALELIIEKIFQISL